MTTDGPIDLNERTDPDQFEINFQITFLIDPDEIKITQYAKIEPDQPHSAEARRLADRIEADPPRFAAAIASALRIEADRERNYERHI